jgi:hypothetical protein
MEHAIADFLELLAVFDVGAKFLAVSTIAPLMRSSISRTRAVAAPMRVSLRALSLS